MIKLQKQYFGLNITINTTEDCNLACKYCYETNKHKKTLKLEDAKKFIDQLLQEENPVKIPESSDLDWLLDGNLILDFIGGDALINADLVRQILYYFIWQSNLLGHKWSNRYRVSITTNGTLFNRKEVRDFLEEFSGLISLTVSIDGIPTIHDLYRVFPDGTGTSEAIRNQLEYYIDYCRRSNQLPTTKATMSKCSIPYMFSSLVYLNETLGIKNIYMNFIMEDMKLEPEDIKMFDEQMEKCIEYILDNPDVYWSMLDEEKIGRPFDENNKSKLRCGSGVMPCLGIDGNIYPCFRWLPHTTTQDNKYLLGDIEKGFKHTEEKMVADITDWDMSDDECRACPIQSACSFCVAGCYAEFGEFKRTKYICEITKIHSKWVKKYWELFNDR